MLTLRSDAINRAAPSGRTRAAALAGTASEMPDIWPVEQTSEYDLYSNGLRIENQLAISNEPDRII